MPGSLTAGRERLFSPITSARTSTCTMHPLGRWNGTLDYSFHREIICFFVCVLSNPFLVSALTLTFIWLQTKCSFICPNRVSVGICPWNFPFFVMGKQASCGVLCSPFQFLLLACVLASILLILRSESHKNMHSIPNGMANPG